MYHPIKNYQEPKPLNFCDLPNHNYNKSITSSYNIERPKITYDKKVDYSVI